jgi:hypothetical protein
MLLLTKYKLAKPGNLSKCSVVSEIQEHWMGRRLNFVCKGFVYRDKSLSELHSNQVSRDDILQQAECPPLCKVRDQAKIQLSIEHRIQHCLFSVRYKLRLKKTFSI